MKTILIIEDEEPLRFMLSELLKGAGYRAIAAAGGQQAIRLARAHQPDLALCDIRMPGMDGHAVLAEFRRVPGLEDVPFIIMTAHAALPDMRRGMKLGADDYLAKPFENAELLAVVAQHLARAGQRREQAGREIEAWRRSLGQLLPRHFVAPLHDIIGCASVLAMDAAVMPPAEVREFAQSIQDAGERLHRQIENFLLYTGLETGLPSPQPGPPVAVDDLLRELAERIASRHRRSGTVRLSLQPVTAELPREHLAKLLGEAIDNACRHTPADSPVDISLAHAGNTFRVRVSDQGAGVPASARPHSPAGSPPPRRDGQSSGAGLGLYLSRRLTQLLGGGWELASEPGRGTTVTFTFPLEETPDAA